jgi:ParB/Sulfiredoxin domain
MLACGLQMHGISNRSSSVRSISTEGFQRPNNVSAGPAPMLQWIKIEHLLVDESYQRPILGKGRNNVDRIAREFSWACFAPVVVAPVEGGRFAIIDGQHRTTAAALAGFDTVPCQVVIAAQKEQAAAFKAINGITTPISRMALHAAALVAQESWAVELTQVCATAGVELLRYPIPSNSQRPGQTMAVSALSKCLKQYGRETLITALQCVTETSNNVPGALTARLIKAICEVLDANKDWRDAGLALLEAFDIIDLETTESNAAVRAATEGTSRSLAITSLLRDELGRCFPVRAHGRGDASRRAHVSLTVQP